MSHIEILYCRDSSQSFNLAVNAVKCSGCLKLALPRILIITSHIVVCMITCNNHQRTKNNFLITSLFNLIDNCLTCCIFRLTLNGSDKYVLVSKVFHLSLHLIISYICSMRSTMSHEYKCCSVFCCCIYAVKSCFFYCCINKCLCNCFLVIVDHCSIFSDFTKHWLCDCNGFKFIFILIDCFYHLIIFCSMHKMCRLYNQVLNSVVNCTLECLIHVVNCFVISCLYMVDDDLCCESSSYSPVRISFCQSVFDSLDILCTAVIERSTKAYYKDFILTDLVLIARIIFGSIPCVTSEIFRACFFAFYQFFLCICQCIPCFFGSFAVLICCVSSFLNIDLVDQCCYIICCCLVII